MVQGLLDYPRAGLQYSDVLALIGRSGSVEVGAGLELFRADTVTSAVFPDNPAAIVADISDVLVVSGSSVEYDNTAKVGGTATLVLDPAVYEELTGSSLIQDFAAPGSIDSVNNRFYWGNPRTRLRPYVTLTAPGHGTAKFYQGVYIPGSPQTSMDSDQPLYTVTCYDQTSIFDVPITESINYNTGDNVVNAVQLILFQFQTASESSIVLLQNTSRESQTLIAPMGWGVNSGATYLDVMNDLLATIGYDPLWCDEYGYYLSTPFNDPRTRAPDWIIDATDPNYSIVDPSGSTWQPDVWQVPNTWLFLQNGLNTAPVEGLGQYTVTNQSNGPTSIDKQIGRVILSYHELDATSQTDLVTQGNAIVVSESLPAELFTTPVTPLPILWHKDAIRFIADTIEGNLFGDGVDPRVRQCYVQSWQLPLDGSDMTISMGTVA